MVRLWWLLWVRPPPQSPTTAAAAAESCCCRCSGGGGVGGDEWWGYGGAAGGDGGGWQRGEGGRDGGCVAATVGGGSDGGTMSSPNHPTSNIEDAFSSNFLHFIPASSDYVHWEKLIPALLTHLVSKTSPPDYPFDKLSKWLRVVQRKCGRPITHKSHKSKYSIHPGSNKIYQDLEKFYWLSSRGVVLEISRRMKG
nr:reverse transcriptase domain-containing protein [Tanacetum cinerariifolium]